MERLTEFICLTNFLFLITFFLFSQELVEQKSCPPSFFFFLNTLELPTINQVFYCSSSSGLERDKFDNKTVTFEEHIKEEHNMWHYLFFIVLVKVKDSTEYTGPESYVAEMIKVNKKHRHTLKTDIHLLR